VANCVTVRFSSYLLSCQVKTTAAVISVYLIIYTVSQKTTHFVNVHIFIKYWPISKNSIIGTLCGQVAVVQWDFLGLSTKHIYCCHWQCT